jgi:outer membrane protein OmpA-like peptidoglycan-associated protein
LSQTASSIAARIGESEDSVSRALEPALTSILGAMSDKADDPGMLRYMFDLVQSASVSSLTSVNITNLASSGAAGSPLFDMSRRLLPILFDNKQDAVAQTIERASGLSSGGAARMISLATPVVLSFLGKRMRDQGMSLSDFKKILQREPAGLEDKSPIGSRRLMMVLTVLAVVAAVLWFASRDGDAGGRSSRVSAATENTSRSRFVVSGLDGFATRKLPDGVKLRIPENGTESKLLSLLENPAPGTTSAWLDFDRLTFDTASALLRPESEEQLQNMASIMKAYPRLRLRIGGYSDNQGNSKANIRLSQNRAAAVTRELSSMGINSNRMESEGYGSQYAIAGDSTEEGRARNRRISMRVLQK